jgi:hypothetical protein
MIEIAPAIAPVTVGVKVTTTVQLALGLSTPPGAQVPPTE